MSQPDSGKPRQLSRRSLFAGAGTVGAVAAAATLIPAVKNEPEAMPARVNPERGGGYSLSEHVKHYYRTTRI